MILACCHTNSFILLDMIRQASSVALVFTCFRIVFPYLHLASSSQISGSQQSRLARRVICREYLCRKTDCFVFLIATAPIVAECACASLICTSFNHFPSLWISSYTFPFIQILVNGLGFDDFDEDFTFVAVHFHVLSSSCSFFSILSVSFCSSSWSAFSEEK